ncbi:tetraacyldisaccharide 4'-kinase [Helicobacter anatolicus]|uniref:tetraacyldisaccharide 4'-kinase n=1 Tax=Helicobacter anatolicus TaxID=2905874 RepID=UPI001E373B99|nr:tetraacyldisaccharide 4'-kinase [Helicobacter anatolicus]MCE3039196.1 tetraacyldisaccharide 4'-kinase [Helicobacter anatolicus]
MRFIDRYFYKPNFWQKILAICLLPISLLYFIASTLRRKFSKFQDFQIPIISIGNLVAGGSGKTPFIIETAKNYKNVAIILRGYKRKSKGLLVISHKGEILSTQEQAGDEAYLIAKKLPNASVIVCKKRHLALEKAKEMGIKIVFLDDGFRFNYKKLNILLKPKLQPYFNFCIPSGIYRENPYLYNTADLTITEDQDYKRIVTLKNPTKRMLLVTAIANPSRLDQFLPDVVGKITLNDHSTFNKDFLTQQLKNHNATSLLVTQKDEVKLLDFGLPLSILELKLEIKPEILQKIDNYIKNYNNK